jgi:hypothetical protein
VYRLRANVVAGQFEPETAAEYDPAQLPDAMERASGLDR